MANLRTDYKDDILNTSRNERRKYNMITNADGTVSFVDVTEYTQVGDVFGASTLNTITDAINNSGTVRYDAETDMIQILGSDGEWHDWQSGGLGKVYLYNLGDKCTSLTGGWQSDGSNSYSNKDNADNLYSMSGGQSSSWSYWETKNNIDVSQKTKICLDIETTRSNTSNKVELYNGSTLISAITVPISGVVEINIASLSTIKPRIRTTSNGGGSSVTFTLKACYVK